MGAKILLVEDNMVNRRLAEFLLRSQGYQVREAASASEAFELVNVDRPDLILIRGPGTATHEDPPHRRAHR